MVINYITFNSPVGWIALCATADGICRIDFCGSRAPSLNAVMNNLQELFASFELDTGAHRPLLEGAREAVARYFSEQVPLPEIPLDIHSGTAFQRDVWQSLYRIPFGETRSYVDIARDIGKPKAARAVGQACGKNPIPIIVPCHRVISQNGSLGGYSSGLDIKQVLLKLENVSFDS